MTGHLYFIGIAGHTMRGLAKAARDNGYEVTGLDETAIPPGSDWLDQQKLTWHRRFHPGQLQGVTAVIVTGQHASDDHPAIVEARRRELPIKSYAQLFGEFTAGERVLAVTGTHGKTTTTTLIAWLLESAGRHPDYLIGILPFNFDSSVRFTASQVAVVEGDEYKASSLESKSKIQYYHPDALVLTAVEHDHPDMYPDLAAVVARFKEIISALPKSSQLIAWAGSQTVMDLAQSAPGEVTTYGHTTGDYTARAIAYQPAGLEFDIESRNQILSRIAVPLYGRHNVLNVLAATVTALGEGLTIAQIIAAAATFRGAARRFNLVTPAEASITIVDDYAHHPTEVATNIEAAKLHFKRRRLIAVFRPHTYSRTKALLREYQAAFDKADIVYITGIEGAREAGGEQSVSGRDIAGQLKTPAHYIEDRAKLIDHIQKSAQPGDVILCMTVSGYGNLTQELAQKLVP